MAIDLATCTGSDCEGGKKSKEDQSETGKEGRNMKDSKCVFIRVDSSGNSITVPQTGF